MTRVKKGSSGEGTSGDQPPPPDNVVQLKGSPSKPASRAVTRKKATAKSPQRMDRLWQILDDKIGGREGLLGAALASGNPKAKQLIESLLDKNYKTYGTKKLAEKAGISAPEVVDMFRDAKWLEATLVLHEELPEIIRDTAQDARASLIACPDCRGLAVDAEGRPCLPCEGLGRIRKPGDKDKLAFVGEAVGMIKNRQPLVQVNTQINNPGQTGPQSFDDLMRKASVTISKPKQIEGPVDAELVDDGIDPSRTN